MSARVVLTYDGISLQTSTIVTQTIQHESIDNKRQDIQSLGRADGGKIVSVTFGPKLIRLQGTIKGTTQADLETNIDTLKALINRQQKNLDVGYAGGTRRYITSSSRFTMQREHYHLTYAEWEAEFIVSTSPFGRPLDTGTFSDTIASTGSSAINHVFVGTARPLPIIRITVNSQTSLTAISLRNKNTGDIITVRRTFANSDVLVIDTRPEGFTVTVNGTAVDYEGFFPEFVTGANDLVLRPVASACNLTVKLIYYPNYL
jgi:hypothetical protein